MAEAKQWFEVAVSVEKIVDGEAWGNEVTTPVFWFVDEDEALAYADTLVNFLGATQGVDEVDADDVFEEIEV